MYNTTTALASALATQKLYTKVVYGSTTIGAEQVKKCVYSGSFGGADTVTIGGVTAAMVTLTLSGTHNLRDKTITVSVGADVSGTVQYVPLGTFVVATCKQVDDTTTVTAYDAAYYALGGTYTPTVSSGATVAAVLSDVATQCGLTLATLPAAASTTNVVGDLTGKTCRDMVGYLAALVGCNALIDRDGKLALRWFADSGQSYSPSDYYNAGLSIDGTSTLACIRAEVETTTTDADGNTSVTTNAYTAGSTGVGITIQNPYMTQAILDTVWASIGGLEYTVGSCDIFHGLLTEPGDLVTITDKAGAAHTLAVMTLELSIDGGCRAKIQATANSATDTDANVSGSMTKQITKIAKDVMEFYTIVAKKAKVTDLEATNAEISRLKTGKADVKDLTAATGRIDSLETDVANANKLIAAELNATNAEVSNLKTDKADVDLLNVVKATIESLFVRGGIITDSLSGVEINATKFLTGVTIIGDVIKAGTLQANRIILTGENGLIYELNVNAGNLTASQLTQEQYKQALDGSVLVASSITTDKLAAGSVTAQVIASGAVDTDKLAANAVKAINIESGAITTDKLAAKAVTSDKVETGAITTDKLAAKAVKAEKIDVENLFAQDITASGRIKSANYNGAEPNPLKNTSGSILKMDDGTFNFAGGKLVYDGSDLVLDGKIKGEAIDIEGGDATGKIRLYSEYVVNEKTGVREYPRFEIVAQGDTSESRVMATPPELNLYSRAVGINAGVGGVVLGGSSDSETGNYVTAIYLRGVTNITGGLAEVTVGNNSVEITAGQQPDDASIEPYVQIGKFEESVYLFGDIYINNVRPYYQAGDKLTGKWKGGGYVTTAKKEVVFTVPLAKPIIGNPTITVAASLIIRQASKYTHGSASSTKVKPSSYEVERGIGDAICITCVMSDLTNAVNNDACAVAADLTITFS